MARSEYTVTIGGVDHTLLLTHEEAERRYGDLAKKHGGGGGEETSSSHTKKATPPNKAATPKDK